MSNPKYADLPGIAQDEPDIYQTKDLPESEQADDFYEPESETVVERIHITSEEAYGKFKGKFLDSSSADFSERIGRKICTGYDARSGNWDLAGPGEKETPIQKYHRLQCEMGELLEEVNNLNKNTDSNQLDCLVSTDQVEQSLKLLADLKLEETLGEELIAKISDPEGAQLEKLLAQLKQFKQCINEEPEAQKQNEADSGIVYQFTFRPELAKLKQSARVADLESRLHRLESVIGASPDKLSRLTTATNKGSLLEVAQYLSATASLLNSSQLDHMEGRLSALSQKLQEITEKKKELQQDEEKDKMLLELYEQVKNLNVDQILPQTIERLKSLEALHNKATEFTKTLTQIELAQSEIKSNFQNNKTLLQGVQESFALNLNEINQTVMSLDARIKALKNK